MIAKSERQTGLAALNLVDLGALWPAPAGAAQDELRARWTRRSGQRGLNHAELARATMEAREALEEAVAAAAVATQRAIDVAEALDETLSILAAESGPAMIPAVAHEVPRDVETLSPREREVLALVAEGRSNKAIAEALFVSPNTIKTHVASLLSKLHAESRVQLAAIAARKGMSKQYRDPNAA
ncbi:MAG: response regulator transcription factor [Thermomicrobiales bacterium]